MKFKYHNSSSFPKIGLHEDLCSLICQCRWLPVICFCDWNGNTEVSNESLVEDTVAFGDLLINRSQ